VLCRELAALRAGEDIDLTGFRRACAEELDRRVRDMTDAFEHATELLENTVAPREEP
jgi:hypothetical protein